MKHQYLKKHIDYYIQTLSMSNIFQKINWEDLVLPTVTTPEDGVVYWIHDESCKLPQWDGYIGVTTLKRLTARKLEHKRSNRFPPEYKFEIISTSNIESCFMYEAVLRPYPNMGWNKAAGGARGHKIGNKRSFETKKKISESKLGKSRHDLALRNKSSSIKCSCILCKKTTSIGYLYGDHRNCFASANIKWSENKFKHKGAQC